MLRSKLMIITSLLAILVFTFAAAFPVKAASSMTIYDIASSNPDFETLTAALNISGLASALDGKGQFTVFAPTDAAFANLPAGTLDALVKPENRALLTNILLYHVARGNRPAADVISADQIRMMNKDFTEVSMMGGSYYIDNAKIIVTDIYASNGVIHVIDAVLIP